MLKVSLLENIIQEGCFMKKLLCILLIFTLSSCSSPWIKKPQVQSVKKVAIISIYANADLHDVKSPKKPATKLSVLKAMLGKEKDKSLETNEFVQIVTYGLQIYGQELDKIGNWSVIPPQNVLKSQKYKTIMSQKGEGSVMGGFLEAIQKAVEAQWVTPPGMPYIPASCVTHGRGMKVVVKGSKDPVLAAREKMAEICKELDVDAVALIGLDLAYKKGWLSGMRGTGLLGEIRGKATPAVASEIIVVTKDAEIAVESPLVEKQAKYYKSYSAPMMLEGRPDIKDSKGKSVEAYNQAVKNSAQALNEKINQEFSK